MLSLPLQIIIQIQASVAISQNISHIDSYNNFISGNSASDNNNDGINLETSHDNTISGNTANNNDNLGIVFNLTT